MKDGIVLFTHIHKPGGTSLDNDLARLKADQASFNMVRLNASRFQTRAIYDRLWVPYQRRKAATAAP